MITFKNHIEISEHKNSKNGFSNYVNSLSPEDKIKFTRDVSNTYPITPSTEVSSSLYKRFKVYENVMDLVLGQFIMIEQIVTGKKRYSSDAENDLEIAKLLLRPKHHGDFDNENIKDEVENENLILDSEVTEIYSLLTKYFSNREYVLFKQFSGVFYETPDEDEDEDEETGTDPAAEMMFNQQWYWYSIVRMLAQEDITRYNDIYMLKMSTVMPEMSYLAQKSKIESAKNRQIQAMRKL